MKKKELDDIGIPAVEETGGRSKNRRRIEILPRQGPQK